MQSVKDSIIKHRKLLLGVNHSDFDAEYVVSTENGSFNILYPEEYDFPFLDIAKSLACRYAGHDKGLFSIAEYSVIFSKKMPVEYAFEALMHDAVESILCDIKNPLKSKFRDYESIELWIDSAFRKRYGLPPSSTSIINRSGDLKKIVQEKIDPPNACLPWQYAYRLFVQRAIDLKKNDAIPIVARSLIPDIIL